MIPIVGDDCHYNPVRRRLVEGQAGENQKRRINERMESVSKIYCDERLNANNLSHPIAKLCNDLSALLKMVFFITSNQIGLVETLRKIERLPKTPVKSWYDMKVSA